MGRKDRYATHIEPHLNDIKMWVATLTEGQIASKLGVGVTAFTKYKKQHPELVEVLREGKRDLCVELKETLKKKAKGYYYTETKTTQRKENGKSVVIVEKFEKYAQPDTGAIHLLLKNFDPEWRNDDKPTMDLKKEQVEIARQKAEESGW